MTPAGARGCSNVLAALVACLVGVGLGCVPMGSRLDRYRPGFLLQEPLTRPGKPTGAAAARRVGCLDVRMALACNAAVPADYPVVAFTFGNRCDTDVPVDFTRLRVTGRAGGESAPSVPLSAFDPVREIHPALLGSGGMGREVLEYDAAPRETTRDVTEVCIDLAELTKADGPVPPACLARPLDGCGRS